MFVVAGGSGQTGSVVADTLLRQGKQVRLIARDPTRVAALRARGAEVVKADLHDAAALTEALRGAAGAYLLLPPNMAAPDLLAIHRKQTAALAQAVAAAQPAHVVCLSAMGAQQSSGTGPGVSLTALEQALNAVCQNVTYVRAAYFMESLGGSLPGLADGVFPTFLRADQPFAMVASSDVGAVAARALLLGAHGRDVIELEGPRRYSAIEIASELSQLVGRTIRAHELPEAAVVPTLVSFGVSATVAELAREMFHAMNTGYLSWEHDESERVRGTTEVGQVLSKMLAPLAAQRAS